jgi:hypothetical protein
VALESEQQLMVIAMKSTKKHEILFLFSCDSVGFVANNTPAEIKFKAADFLAGGWADI